jgi:preprotein translocase subunit SecG
VKIKYLFLFISILLCIFNVVQVYAVEETSANQVVLLKLSTNLIPVVIGNRTGFMADVENTGTQPIESVNVYVQGISPNWLEIIPKSANISVGSTQNYLVSINIPIETKASVYKLTVNAKDGVESNTEALSLVVGKDLKEVVDLLTKEFEDDKNLTERSLLVGNCLDVTVIKALHGDAKYAYQRGLEEYQKENYTKVIDYLEYAIPIENGIISRIDKSLEIEINTSKRFKIIVPPFYDSEQQIVQAQTYFDGKNYEEICKPIEKMREYIMTGVIFWLVIMTIIILLILIFLIFYRRKKVKERIDVLERVRERLGEPEVKI